MLKDLLNYNLSIKYIAESNGITSDSVRNILINAMSEYPNYVTNLPRVISLMNLRRILMKVHMHL